MREQIVNLDQQGLPAARVPCWARAARIFLPALILGLTHWPVAYADTIPSLFGSFAGNINFIGTQRTLRAQPDGSNPCAVNTGTTTAILTGLPAGAAIQASYLYWAGSGATPDYSVTFDGSPVTATAARSYTATYAGTYDYFSGVVDVTATVAAKGNGTYAFAGLTVDNGDPWCTSSAVLGGWALLVIYSHSAEDFRVINVYEGFQAFRGSAITLTPSNFRIPSSPINGKDAHLTWEGDVGNSSPLNGFNEQLTFNGNVLTDANNPPNNQFNSVSTINSPVDTASYGVDFDVYDVSPYLAAGQTSATTVYSSGGDLVLLSAQIISTTNEPVADLAISKIRGGALTPGQNATYTLTVTNNGPLTEPGPITIVDTLPAALSYVSATGTGWTCSAAGQVVTCNRSGSLASGASTAALTLTVAVSPTASGTITNTATVSGQLFDNVSANNTATDSFAILPAAYAYYAMDEASWGAVLDSSGNGRNGIALGAAAPTGYPPPTPPGSAIAGNPGTCGSGAIPATGGTQAVNTGIDVNSIGNAGTIAFWYNGNADWDDGNARMLFDASNELGNGGADKHFYLVKDGGGQLRFAFERSDDNNYQARSGAFSFPAGEWHHIAVTWNMGADRARLYLDGVEVAQSANTSGTLGNLATLYLGDQRFGTIQGAPGYTPNSANGYLDEARLYSSALSASDIAAVRNATHPCGLHHLQLEHASGGGLTCNPSTLTVRACADAACSSPYTGGVTGTLTATGAPTVNWVGGAAFAIASGASSVTKDAQVTTPGSVVFGASGVTPAPFSATTCNFGAPSCTFTAADSGFVFDVPNHTAGTTQSVTVSAVRKDDVTQRCVPAFQNATKTVNFWSSYLNPTTGTLAVNVNGTNVAGASPGTAISLAFDANGEVIVPVSYPDVGQMRLDASHSGTGDAAGLVMTGLDNFVTKPARFVLTIPGNPAAPDASGGVFKRAGENFTMTVEAQNAANAITPNYGRESTPETVLLTKTLVAPAPGGNNPALAGSFGAFGQDCSGNPATAGTACGTFSWPEVGIFDLTPSVGDGDYLGAGNVTGIASGNVGRFIPDHFTVTLGGVTNRVDAGCTPASTFTYMGEMLRLGFTLTAQSASPGNATTQNYTGAFAKLSPTNIAALNIGGIDAGAPTPLTGRIVLDTSSGSWSNGIAAIQARLSLSRAAAVDGSFQALRLGVRPEDIDNGFTVTLLPAALDLDVDNDSTNDHDLVATTEVRFGRLYLQNAFGSELLPLPMPMLAQYFLDANTGFVTNTQDGCTSVTPLTLSNGLGSVTGGTGVTKTVNGTATTTATFGVMSGGSANLVFSAPGAGGDGYVDVTPAVGTLPAYLKFDWDGNGAHDNDSSGRATFGVYRGNPRQIYLRERY